ncbi:unnamed protein product [Moneuplotes crassus]|uniref:Uncharacterized protein n=1 Tax=Euplotes crassus TaxID=5936 RepID=A0AAD1XI36_EUPCR|nr:unnamed protein product [Moneuplotes crassus]
MSLDQFSSLIGHANLLLSFLLKLLPLHYIFSCNMFLMRVFIKVNFSCTSEYFY